MDNQSPNCPKCGSGEVVPIRYGYPGAKMWAAYRAGEIELGGCVITGDDPEWRCKACRNVWSTGGPGKFGEDPAAFFKMES